jgi:membrane-bound lytic murein transglycosylase D
VARAYRVSVAELARANQLRESESVAGIEGLVVPVAPAAALSTRTLLYTTRRGDTLVTIADRFGVSLDQLRRWNRISGVRVEPGRRLHVAEPSSMTRTATGRRRGATAKSETAANEAGDAAESTKRHGTMKAGAAANGSKQRSATHVGTKRSGAPSSKTSKRAGVTNHSSAKAATKGKTAIKKKK